MKPSLPILMMALGLGLPAQAETPDIPSARVVMPWSDFKVLYEQGRAPEDKPEPAPRDYAISRASYSGTVDGESTVFRARIQVDVLKEEGWSVVPLLPTSVALREAKLGRSDAPIYLDRGWYWLVTDQAGARTIDLEFAVQTWDNAGQNGFAFELTRSGATEVTLSVPAEDALDFQIANAQQLVETTDRAGNRVVRALLPATGNLSATWQPETPEVEQDAEARIYAEHQALIGVGEGVVQGFSTVNYSILHAGTDAFSLTLPPDVLVLDVMGRGLRDWTVTESDSAKRIDVELNFEAEGAYTLQLEYERPLAEGGGQVQAPQLGILGVERVKGYVGIDARSNLEIAAGTPTAARVVDVRELPAGILGQTDWPVLLGFKYRKDGWAIPLEVRQHDDVDMLVTIVDQVAARTALTPGGRRMTNVTYAMRNNRAQYLRLALPEGATLWSTFVGGKAVKPALGEDGRVLVPLARSQTSAGELSRFAVELVYVEDGAAPDDGGRAVFDGKLPVADVPATSVAWTVYVPRDAKVKTSSIDGSLRQVDWFTPVDVGGQANTDVVQQVQAQADTMYSDNALQAGVQPVKVSLPVDGQPFYFEKLLVLDESLWVRFDYKADR